MTKQKNDEKTHQSTADKAEVILKPETAPVRNIEKAIAERGAMTLFDIESA